MKTNLRKESFSVLSALLLVGCGAQGADPNIAVEGTTELTATVSDDVQAKYPLSMGNNPCITTMFTADPTARVYDDVLYLYPSTDIPDPADFQVGGFCMPGYNAFSTENFMDWKDYGQIIHQSDVEWARQDKYCMWAPCVNKRGDTYYYYFPTHKASGGFTVGVATASNPGGPFEILPDPIAHVGGIDPCSFIDDDGQAYLYWGGGRGKSLRGAKMKDNMTELEGDVHTFEELPDTYKEASFVFKRNGVYYLTYAHANPKNNSELHYATSKSPLGPFECKGKFFDKWDNCWTSHHSIVEYRGELILFYHHNDISHKDKLRSVCADYLSFADNGDINLVKPTLRGIGTTYANREIQIDRYSEGDATKFSNVQIGEQFPANWALTEIQNGASVLYNRVDFSNQKYSKMQVRVASNVEGKLMVIAADSDEVIANVKINATGGADSWQVVEYPIVAAPDGVADLKIVFTGDVATLYSVDWIKFL